MSTASLDETESGFLTTLQHSRSTCELAPDLREVAGYPLESLRTEESFSSLTGYLVPSMLAEERELSKERLP